MSANLSNFTGSGRTGSDEAAEGNIETRVAEQPQPIYTDAARPVFCIWCREPAEEGKTIKIDAKMPFFKRRRNIRSVGPTAQIPSLVFYKCHLFNTNEIRLVLVRSVINQFRLS